jgi:hypothetical protein
MLCPYVLLQGDTYEGGHGIGPLQRGRLQRQSDVSGGIVYTLFTGWMPYMERYSRANRRAAPSSSSALCAIA